MFNMKKAAVVAGLLLASTTAMAGDNKVYFQVHGGWSNDNTMSANAEGASINTGLIATTAANHGATTFGALNFVAGDLAKKKNKYNFGLAVGYQVDNNVRLDLAYSMFNKTSYSLSTQGATAVAGAYTATVAPGAAASAYFATGGSLAYADVAAPNTSKRIDFTGLAGSLKVNTVMLNGYYDFAGMVDGVTPYVNVGLGMANLKYAGTISNISAAFSKNKFAYQLGLGVVAKVTDQFAVDVGYKFNQVRVGDATNSYGGKNLNHNMVNVALRVSL